MIGAVFGATGVLAGALGAHGLKGVLADPDLESFQTAVRYQLLHALALLVAGVLSEVRPGLAKPARPWAMRLAVASFAVGTVLFSGGIYAWLATGARPIVHVVPVGGVVLALGWLGLMAVAVGRGAAAEKASASGGGTPSPME